MQRALYFDARTYTPFNELFGDFLKPARAEHAPAQAAIKIDVTETANEYVVFSEMPGVNKEDINVAVDGNSVTITGDVKQIPNTASDNRTLYTERHFGDVYRRFTLPAELDGSACVATYQNGILELKLPKKTIGPMKRLVIQ